MSEKLFKKILNKKNTKHYKKSENKGFNPIVIIVKL